MTTSLGKYCCSISQCFAQVICTVTEVKYKQRGTVFIAGPGPGRGRGRGLGLGLGPGHGPGPGHTMKTTLRQQKAARRELSLALSLPLFPSFVMSN